MYYNPSKRRQTTACYDLSRPSNLSVPQMWEKLKPYFEFFLPKFTSRSDISIEIEVKKRKISSISSMLFKSCSLMMSYESSKMFMLDMLKLIHFYYIHLDFLFMAKQQNLENISHILKDHSKDPTKIRGFYLGCSERSVRRPYILLQQHMFENLFSEKVQMHSYQ